MSCSERPRRCPIRLHALPRWRCQRPPLHRCVRASKCGEAAGGMPLHAEALAAPGGLRCRWSISQLSQTTGGRVVNVEGAQVLEGFQGTDVFALGKFMQRDLNMLTDTRCDAPTRPPAQGRLAIFAWPTDSERCGVDGAAPRHDRRRSPVFSP
jgi:hypothetical protein